MRNLIDHMTGNPLSKKERTPRVNRKNSIVTLRRCVQNIETLFGSDASIVDQNIDPPEIFYNPSDDLFMILKNGNISLDRQERSAQLFNSLFDLENPAFGVLRIDGSRYACDVIIVARKLDGNAPAYAATRSGYQGDSATIAQSSSLRVLVPISVLYLIQLRGHFRFLVISIQRITP